MCFLSFVGPDIMDTWYPTCTDDMEVEVNKSGEEREPVGREKRNVGNICGNMFEVHKYFH